MNERKDSRLDELTRRGELQRERLAEALFDVAASVRQRRSALRLAGMAATVVAAGGTAAWRLFGAASPAARIGRAASGASILLGLGRAFFRLRRFL